MNLNEACLINYLINPDEIHELCTVFMKNIEEVEKKQKSEDN